MGPNARLTVDLERQVVVRPNGEEISFDIDPFRKHLLLNGLDDIGQTMQRAAAHRRFRGARGASSSPGCRPSPSERKAAIRWQTNKKLLILPGDGVGPEVMREVRRVIDWMDRRGLVSFDIGEDLVGGASIDARGVPITDETIARARPRTPCCSAPSAARNGRARLRSAGPRSRSSSSASSSTCSPICARLSCSRRS